MNSPHYPSDASEHGRSVATSVHRAGRRFTDPVSAAGRKSILVVEDNPVARDALISAATNAGLDAIAAANGEEALAILRGGASVDLIILDLVMPVMDGWEFLKIQKGDLALSSIPVLVLSGLDDLRGQATSLGVVGVLQKPIEFERLCDCIRGFAFQKRPGILIVDDESQIRAMLGMALGHHGYAVWLAAGGQEAVDFYRQHPDKVDVILLDVVMPDLSGRETLTALKKINPDVLCCFISGDPNSNPREALLALGAVAVLEKPFSLVDVSRALREALGVGVRAE